MLYEKGNGDKKGIVMNYRLKGHESFVLRDGWITKVFFALKKENGESIFRKNYGADALGVGTSMAKSIRYWMKASGLTTDVPGKGVFLTELGELLFEYDPYMEDPFSLYVIHANIVLNFEMATSWNVFFNNFSLSSFNRSEMLLKMTDLLIEKTNEHKLPDRSIKDDCSALLSMYYSEFDNKLDPEEKKNSPFSQLNLLTRKGNYFRKTSPNNQIIDPLLVLYLMVDKFKIEKSISIDDLINGENSPGKVLNLNRVSINDCLDKLADKGLVIVNRTAGIDMVYPNNLELNKNDIVKMHFMED